MSTYRYLHSELIALAIHHGDLSRLDPMKDLETIVAQIRWQANRMLLIADALEADHVKAQEASILGQNSQAPQSSATQLRRD